MIGQLAVIHDLQEDIEQVRMGLFDLIKQQHRVRVLIDTVGHQPALVEPDIARRRADQPRNGVTLHVFGHVEAQKLHPERIGELLGHLGLAHTGRAGEHVRTDGLFRLTQTRTGQLDGR